MLSEYCRAIEAHLCRKNDGHLIRIAGPSFEIVAAWATEGIPLKVALAGMARERHKRFRDRRIGRPADEGNAGKGTGHEGTTLA